MHVSMKLACAGLVLAGALRAGDLGGQVSNQSSGGPITITLDEADAGKEDVLVTVQGPPLGRGSQAAPVLLTGAARSRKLEPGQTALITLKQPPSPAEAPASRLFRVTLDGREGCGFTYRVSYRDGKPVGEIDPDEGTCPRADLEQPDPNLVLFWGYLLTGL